MNQIEQAQELMDSEMSTEYADRITQAVANGQAFWRLDPNIDGVVGVVREDSPMQAIAVFYLESRDFEIDDIAIDELAAIPAPQKQSPRRRARR